MVEWLRGLGLSRYAEGFIAEGWDSREALAYMGEDDVLALGVKAGHARRIVVALPRRTR